MLLLQRNDCLFSFDLKSGYHHVDVAEDHQRSLGIEWEGLITCSLCHRFMRLRNRDWKRRSDVNSNAYKPHEALRVRSKKLIFGLILAFVTRLLEISRRFKKSNQLSDSMRSLLSDGKSLKTEIALKESFACSFSCLNKQCVCRDPSCELLKLLVVYVSKCQPMPAV